MTMSREERIEIGRTHAFDPDFTAELDKLDAEDAFETDAELLEAEDEDDDEK
jgi:hypothetical protein